MFELFEPYTVLKFLHIIMAGLWLGMDMGVYLSGSRMTNPNLPIPVRQSMGPLSGLLDMGPRSAVIILLMLGITMSYMGGWGFTGAYGDELAGAAALAGLVWLVGLWHQFWVDHPAPGETRPAHHVKIQQTFRVVDIWIRAVVAGALAICAIWSLVGDGPILADWLKVKLIIFALIVCCGIGIRMVIPHTRAALVEIFKNGSTPEREADLTAKRGKALIFVRTIWALVALNIWISVAKF